MSAEGVEILFIVEEEPGGGYTARAVGEAVFTEAETWAELQQQVRDAVRCHFEEHSAPKLVRLHFVRDEVLVV